MGVAAREEEAIAAKESLKKCLFALKSGKQITLALLQQLKAFALQNISPS